MNGTIMITGATGFIGAALTEKLQNLNYQIMAITRSPQKAENRLGKEVKTLNWNDESFLDWIAQLEDLTAIINLAGENIGSGYWTRKKKKRIVESRIYAGQKVKKIVEQVKKKPNVVIQASAIGYYGSRGDAELDEASGNGEGFLAEVVRKWEAASGNMATRRVVVRIAPPLNLDGGLLAKLKIPFKCYVGGHMGNGEQWVSWIHLQDLLDAFVFLLENESLRGVYNLTAPNPVRAKQFFKLFAHGLNRPSWLHVPAPILKLILGEMADDTLLTSQRVIPGRLVESGFEFRFPDIESAFSDVLRAE